MKKEWIEKVISDEFMIELIRQDPKTPSGQYKGREMYLRFLLEREIFYQDKTLAKAEQEGRTDLYIPGNHEIGEDRTKNEWVEIKCYHGVHTNGTKKFIVSDLEKLSKKERDDLKTFLYFGLYPNKAIIGSDDRISQIVEETKVLESLLNNFMNEKDIHLIDRKILSHKSEDIMIYGHWQSFM